MDHYLELDMLDYLELDILEYWSLELYLFGFLLEHIPWKIHWVSLSFYIGMNLWVASFGQFEPHTVSTFL